MGVGEWRRGPAIGRGSSATVSLATDGRTGEVIAVKSAEIARAGVLRWEQNVLSVLCSPHVVSCLGSDVSSAEDGSGRVWFNVFMEYAPGGSLADEIRRCGGRCDEPLIRWRAHDILRGLVHVHGAGIAHCDIKGRNVLIGSDGRAMIADFGCARWAADDSNGNANSRGQLRGTPMFMAPEAVRGEEQGMAADIWALGCTVIEMATGGAPWPLFTDPVATLHHVAFSGEVPEAPEQLSDEGKDFLARCLRTDPRERWTAQQLLHHPFVATSSPSNAMAKLTSNDLWVSPKGILDQAFWEASTAESDATVSPTERLHALAGASPALPDWTWDANWITVHRGGGDACAMSQEFELDTDTDTNRHTDASISGALHHQQGSHDVSSRNGECSSDSFSNNVNYIISDCNFAITSNGFFSRCCCAAFSFSYPSWPCSSLPARRLCLEPDLL